MSDGFRITGNWDFDGKKKIDKDDFDASKISSKNNDLYKKGKVDFSDGIDKDEAQYIITEFENEGLIDFDDFDIDDADIKKFLKNQGFKNVTNEQIKNMRSVVESIADTYMDANDTAKPTEQYTSVQDIYLTNGGKTGNITVSPSKIDPKNGNIQTISEPGTNKGNDPLKGSSLNELINNAYSLEDLAKEKGLKSTDGVLHNLVDEYLQSNPELAKRISSLNGGKDIKDLSYDEILNTNLYKKGDTAFKVIAPKFNMPAPTGGELNTENTTVNQKQFSAQANSIDIVSGKEKPGENQYNNVTDGIMAQYGISKDDPDYQSNLKAIAFQIANDPENAKVIETYINSLPEDEKAKYLNDNTRVNALLALKDTKGLHLPDNVLVNSISNTDDDKKYNYTTGNTVYQLSPLSPADGKPIGQVELPATFDGKETAGSISNLEDILKYSADPRTGVALTTVDKDGKEVSNIKDEAAQSMATAYMMNSIKDNPEIFAASQEIDGKLQLFGAYDITDKNVLAKMQEGLDAAKKAGLSNEDAATKVREDLIKEFGKVDDKGEASLDNFLEKYGNVNLDNAKKIDFYDKNGNLRFKNEDGTPVSYKVSETYVRFGTAKEVTPGNEKTNTKTTSSTVQSTTPDTTPSSTESTAPSGTPSTNASKTPSSTPSSTNSKTPSKTPSTSSTPSQTPSTDGGTTSKTPSGTPSSTASKTPSTDEDTVSQTPSSSTPVVSTTPSSSAPSITPSSTESPTPSSTPSTSSTPSQTPSTDGGAASCTPSSSESSTPSGTPSTGGGGTFNPTPSIAEPSESTAPDSTPSSEVSTPSTSPTESNAANPGECLPPPPADNTPADTQQSGSTASQIQENAASPSPAAPTSETTETSVQTVVTETTVTKEVQSDAAASETTASTENKNTPEPANSGEPAASKPQEETVTVTTTTTTTTTTENKVHDNTSNVTTSTTDVEIERKVE